MKNTPETAAVRTLAHVFPEFSLGGQQARLARLATGLGGGFRHVVASLGRDMAATTLFPADIQLNVEYLPLRKSSGVSVQNIIEMRRWLNSHKPDLLCTYNWGAMEAVIANRFWRPRPHVHFEDGFGPDETIDDQIGRRVMMRSALLRRSAVVIPSKTLHRSAIDVWKLPRSAVIYAPNGIDVRRFSTQREEDAAGTSITIGAVGALRPEKNLPRLIRAFHRGVASDDARLIIVGEGPTLGDLRALVERLGLQSRVCFPGRTPTPETYYRDFDIFALSSDTEQMPLGLMEAMASGLPVAATDVGDIAGMVSDANRKFVTPALDEGALAASLKALADDALLRRVVGADNREKARLAFSDDAMIAQHREIYEAVMASPTGFAARLAEMHQT